MLEILKIDGGKQCLMKSKLERVGRWPENPERDAAVVAVSRAILEEHDDEAHPAVVKVAMACAEDELALCCAMKEMHIGDGTQVQGQALLATVLRRKYALDITSQDGLVVKSAHCKFCFYFGRCVATEAGGIKRKRGPRTTNQFFGEQFRSEVITKHMQSQHSEKWTEYSAQSSARQDSFLDMTIPRANTMHNYIDVDSDEINLVISVIIGEMMFRPASDDVWALALSFDGSTHRGTCFMDIRNHETMIVKLHNALSMGWIRMLIGVTTDGEKTNMGHRIGVQVRMVRYAQFKVVQVWCAPHQLDLQVHLCVDEIDGGAWVKKTYGPKKTNRWIALGTLLNFDIAHEPRITTFFAERAVEGNTAQPPVLMSTSWILVHALSPSIELITETFVKLQQRNLVLCKQRKLFVVLDDEIADLFKVCRIADCEGNFDDLPVNTYVLRNQSIVLIASLRDYVEDLGSHARVHWEKLDNIEQSQVFKTIGLFAIGITDGIRQVEAERDPMNNPSIELAPPICRTTSSRRDPRHLSRRR
ncbi:hypothetical protein H310_13506 [Aphanomyces invadans]|uniref:Uncharacterized protein n=1 Tax=Aphanomyces invadans TaxID=157072 RepID=A0A024TFG4_9STRA|nr:hypothetical protein H310_13506 [Aphanomyces invadans]ETV92087.1 hypothetical protein H310_13506 [Aphanomyces invadans]|eukprot:XP_008879249.1 hypothetical protein H310_13506 [Aphanomyces invadans]